MDCLKRTKKKQQLNNNLSGNIQEKSDKLYGNDSESYS